MSEMEPQSSIIERSAMSIFHAHLAKFIFLIIIQLHLNISDVIAEDPPIPGLEKRQNLYYARPGDLNIAHLTSVSQMNNSALCNLLVPLGVVRSEALRMAIESINDRTDILPNITIGFLSIDDCWNGQKALEAAVYLLQQAKHPTCSTDDDGSNGQVIIGALGPSNSPMSVSVAPFFGVFRIPVMSLYATSDDLSDKTRYEYFLRLVPPDSFQEQTILEIARRLGWTYLSLLYTEGAYGENAATQINRFFRNGGYDICLSVSIRIPGDATDVDYESAVSRLLDNPTSRVVLAFLQGPQQAAFFKAVRDLAGLGTFLFLSGDTLQQNEGEPYADVLEGSIYTDMPAYPIPGFMDRLRRLTPWTDPGNVWLSSLWESTFSCQLQASNSSTALPICGFTSEGLLQKLDWSWSLPVRTYDGVYVFARAVDQLIRDDCPAAFENKSLLSQCVDGSKLLQYLINSTTDGAMGRIEFNANGDLIGDIVIRQYQKNPSGQSFVYVEVGNWTSATNEIRLDMNKLSWKAFMRNDTTTTTQVLESVCSKPCRADEYAIRQDVPCCWNCVKCRDNEVVKDNVTGCQSCPIFTWPEQQQQQPQSPSNATRCTPIPPTYLRLDNPISVALLLLAIIGFLISLSVMVVYHVKRDHRLVKATSRELSLLILCGTLLASVAVVFFIAKPANGLCVCRSVGFHGAINLLYGPLLVKNIRTYRIFRAGQKSVRIPVGVGRNAQMVFAFAITCVQMTLIVISEMIDGSVAALKMPSTYEKYVEIYCVKSVLWFLVPLAFNILLMMLCALLGHATRRLPENFNESQFIFVSVATTLFAWVVFVPAYYSAVYAYLQSAILGFCLLLNVFVTLGCQFLRIVYAVYFVAPDKMNFRAGSTTIDTSTTVVRTHAPDQKLSKVSPSQFMKPSDDTKPQEKECKVSTPESKVILVGTKDPSPYVETTIPETETQMPLSEIRESSSSFETEVPGLTRGVSSCDTMKAMSSDAKLSGVNCAAVDRNEDNPCEEENHRRH